MYNINKEYAYALGYFQAFGNCVNGSNWYVEYTDRESLKKLRLILEKHENYFMELLSVVDLVISQGGVNTVNEIRSIGVPAIFIPADRETQILRTKKMTMISESKCLINPTPKALAQQVINFHERYLKDVNKFQKSRKNKLQCSSAKIIDFLLKK